MISVSDLWWIKKCDAEIWTNRNTSSSKVESANYQEIALTRSSSVGSTLAGGYTIKRRVFRILSYSFE